MFTEDERKMTEGRTRLQKHFLHLVFLSSSSKDNYFSWRLGLRTSGTFTWSPSDPAPPWTSALWSRWAFSSVPDPNLDPNTHFLGPPGSGSTSQEYGSGFRSFYHQAKIVRKTLLSTVLWLLLDFLSLKNDVNAPSKSNKQKNLFLKISFLLASWRSMTKIAGSAPESGSISQRHGSADTDPDPHQKVMHPEHWFLECFCSAVVVESDPNLASWFRIRIQEG